MEKKKFKGSENLLRTIISSQSSGLKKAVQELLQNAIDANPTQIDITFDGKTLIVYDDGEGFRCEEDFQIFGESTKTVGIGKFHMGRGQVIGLGKCVFESNEFIFKTDFQKNGLDYTSQIVKETIRGTKVTVELYEETDQDRLNIRVLDERIVYNGERIKLPEKLFETDDYIVYKGSYWTDVYQQGIYITNVSGGDGYKINFKRQLLELTIARDNFKNSEIIGQVFLEMGRMNKLKRPNVAMEFVKPEMVKKTDRIFKDTQGKIHSLKDLKKKKVIIREKDGYSDDIAEKGYVVFDDGYDVRQFIEQNVSEDEIIKLKEKLMKRVYKTVRAGKRQIEYIRCLLALQSEMVKKEIIERSRKIYVGWASDAYAWTNGVDKLHIRRDRIGKIETEFVMLDDFVHELSHDEDTTATHDGHGDMFNEKYRKIMEYTMENWNRIKNSEIKGFYPVYLGKNVWKFRTGMGMTTLKYKLSTVHLDINENGQLTWAGWVDELSFVTQTENGIMIWTTDGPMSGAISSIEGIELVSN